MFKTGQKVVCTYSEWKNHKEPTPSFAPKKNEIYNITKINRRLSGIYLILQECSSLYEWSAKYFRPLDYDFVEEVIRQVTEKPIIIS